ncbi:MAG: hypothetical protein M1835_008211 [Candelina submexicana]|nr:MAG: hypothetical protein M1835_008211 [Candelina submexicana]
MAQNHPPRAFSPLQSTPSPSSSGAFPPPPKRQRLSPNPPSPYTSSAESPKSANLSLPVYGQQSQGNISMAPPPGPGVMGPPLKPVEKATDTADLTDVVAGSGIDIREEEAALTHSYYNSNPQPALNGSYPTNNTSSFNSTSSTGSQPGALSASNSFTYPSQSGHSAQRVVYNGSLSSQQAAPHQSTEQFESQEWKEAIRRLNESRQYHLHDPFLNGNTLRHRVGVRTYENGVTYPVDGLLDKQIDDHPGGKISTHTITGPKGVKVVAARAALLDKGALLSDILALLSLATQERIRGLVEDAAALAKGRRVGSNGVVPAEWSDLALGNGINSNTMASFGRNGGDSAVSPMSIPMKRSHSTANLLPTPISDSAKSPGASITYPNHTAQTLRGLAQGERNSEEARLARRARRTASGATSADGTKASTPGLGASGGLLGERAPEVEVKKMTKKELAKHSTKENEAYAHSEANKTANRMLGGGSLFGKKKGGYSWMTGGVKSGTSTPSRLDTAVGGSSTVDIPGVGLAPSALPGTGRRFGEWSEARERGAGIQIRDWLNVLEADGKEKKSLLRAYSRMKSRD